MNPYVELTEEHIAALKETLKEVVRAELLEIFSERPGNAMTHAALEHAVLCYLSRISKVHEENAIGNKVDTALANAFNIYRSVHGLEEELIRRICGEMLSGFQRQLIAKMQQLPHHY